jgi:hypothetical protein
MWLLLARKMKKRLYYDGIRLPDYAAAFIFDIPICPQPTRFGRHRPTQWAFAICRVQRAACAIAGMRN